MNKNPSFLIQQTFFIFKYKYKARFISFFRKMYFGFLGMKFGENTRIPKMQVTWPHQVVIGSDCRLENDIYFKFDGIWEKGPSIFIGDDVFIGANCEFNITKSIKVGSQSRIASGCKFIDHNHSISNLPKSQRDVDIQEEIILGKDIWLGFNVVVLMGVEIGDSAIVAAGAVVTKSIPPNEIWGGIPAQKIGERRN